MAKDESTSSGILSKMVKFVRNPTTNWTDLDSKGTDRQSTYSKQALKEMIERKRRNDFVRKREFDMLRKLRRREAMSEHDVGARPSFFQSSLPSKPDDRAMTLKKIDEIEAQMSMQWWKTKHGSVSSGQSHSSSFSTSEITSNPPSEKPVSDIAYNKTQPVPLEHRTNANAGSRSLQSPATRNISSINPGMNAGIAASYEGASSGFTPSKMFSIDVGEVQHDPELEEAAIRFANGDDAGAEAGLREVLGPKGSRVRHEDTWLALFDLYRATGQQDSFENAALDFANRFNRSAPAWFSMPDLVGKMSSTVVAPQDGQTVKTADWRCPPQLTLQSLAALNGALSKAPAPWHLDWARLQSIDANAVGALGRLFSAWASQPVQLRFTGCAQLDTIIQILAPSGQAEIAQEAWLLRMEALRIMHRPDEFELVALDFCVTYEVSPPAWESARCEFKSLDQSAPGGSNQTIIGEAQYDSMLSELHSIAGEMQSEADTQIVTVELAGYIQGDANAALVKLESRMEGANVMIVSCAKLIRVDFSAAGSLLNWVSSRQREGSSIQFSQVHRLVAAFFHVIGISEHAKVVPRTD